MLYDIYGDFIKNGIIGMPPPIVIPETSTDRYIVWDSGMSIDAISTQYYGTPLYGRAIVGANLQYGLNEFEYKSGDIIRIPYPKNKVEQLYYEKIRRYLNRNENE